MHTVVWILVGAVAVVLAACLATGLMPNGAGRSITRRETPATYWSAITIQSVLLAVLLAAALWA